MHFYYKHTSSVHFQAYRNRIHAPMTYTLSVNPSASTDFATIILLCYLLCSSVTASSRIYIGIYTCVYMYVKIVMRISSVLHTSTSCVGQRTQNRWHFHLPQFFAFLLLFFFFYSLRLCSRSSLRWLSLQNALT